ncbi:helix-turn-helix domain-containing protein [Paenibacillus gorillae]|uniref:helix-turn-helix domain-containing protein n=1 Tax=Paenibacillus gorillae TaxID=1243662 RepID=UPI0004B4F5FD|nr:AraC family transcriptional regulator [Paenibacillus gorillae]
MKPLNELKPYVGDSMRYLYEGGLNEKLRVCNVYAFHLFVDGPGEMEVNGKLYPIDRRTLIFLRPGEPHAFHVQKGQPLSSYNLYCDMWEGAPNPVSLNRMFVHAPEPFAFDTRSVTEPCPELDSLPSRFSLQPYPWLFDSFVTLAKQFDDTRYYHAELVNSLLYAWMLSWYNVIHTHQPSDFRIVKLLAQLDEHPETRASVEEWSAMCGLKRSYFHSLFLRETGFTPNAYRHRLLMKRAAHLLVETNFSVTAISERLGYTSIHPFTRHFSAFHGVSPRAYRFQPSPDK